MISGLVSRHRRRRLRRLRIRRRSSTASTPATSTVAATGSPAVTPASTAATIRSASRSPSVGRDLRRLRRPREGRLRGRLRRRHAARGALRRWPRSCSGRSSPGAAPRCRRCASRSPRCCSAPSATPARRASTSPRSSASTPRSSRCCSRRTRSSSSRPPSRSAASAPTAAARSRWPWRIAGAALVLGGAQIGALSGPGLMFAGSATVAYATYVLLADRFAARVDGLLLAALVDHRRRASAPSASARRPARIATAALAAARAGCRSALLAAASAPSSRSPRSCCRAAARRPRHGEHPLDVRDRRRRRPRRAAARRVARPLQAAGRGARRRRGRRAPARLRRLGSPPMTLPLSPPLLPQLARSRASLPEGDGLGLRAQVGRVPRDRLRRRRRGRACSRATAGRCTRYFPELEFPPGRYVLDGEIVIARRRRARGLRRARPAHPPGRVARSRGSPRRRRPRFVAFDLLARDDEVLLELPYEERRAALEALVAAPVELTPMVARRPPRPSLAARAPRA